jgi:hypothetical protein
MSFIPTVENYQDQFLDWIISIDSRFTNMFNGGVDLVGKPALDKALKHFKEYRKFTPGAVQYWFDRSHPNGGMPKYNTHRGLHKQHGMISTAPVDAIILSGLVDWEMKIDPAFIKALEKSSTYKFNSRSKTWSRKSTINVNEIFA